NTARRYRPNDGVQIREFYALRIAAFNRSCDYPRIDMTIATTSQLRGRLGERLVGQLLGERRVDAVAVLLLDRADHAAGHLGIPRRQLGDRGGDRVAQLGLAERLREELAAPRDLEVELVELVLAAIAGGRVLGARLLHRLLVRRDHVEDQRV